MLHNLEQKEIKFIENVINNIFIVKIKAENFGLTFYNTTLFLTK